MLHCDRHRRLNWLAVERISKPAKPVNVAVSLRETIAERRENT